MQGMKCRREMKGEKKENKGITVRFNDFEKRERMGKALQDEFSASKTK